MPRFSGPPDPLFHALNASIAFDYRLAPYDLEQSLAHARMLAHSGIITAEELAELERGLAEVRREVEEDRFEIAAGEAVVHAARALVEQVGHAAAVGPAGRPDGGGRRLLRQAAAIVGARRLPPCPGSPTPRTRCSAP